MLRWSTRANSTKNGKCIRFEAKKIDFLRKIIEKILNDEFTRKWQNNFTVNFTTWSKMDQKIKIILTYYL